MVVLSVLYTKTSFCSCSCLSGFASVYSRREPTAAHHTTHIQVFIVPDTDGTVLHTVYGVLPSKS